MTAPCYKCEDRTPTCHCTCEKYLAFRRQKDIEIAMRQEKNLMWKPKKKGKGK